MVEILQAVSKEEQQRGVTFIGTYITLGRYDAVVVVEAPRIEDVFKGPIATKEIETVEILVWAASVKKAV